MKDVEESRYYKACRDLCSEVGISLSLILAPDPHFPDREMTEEEDRILCAYLERVNANFEKLSRAAYGLGLNKRHPRR